ncbi:unnamed protein product [Dicrocoelium dendriticum]|nr:unnamed protein product [Dicrocoelium dendriticum]
MPSQVPRNPLSEDITPEAAPFAASSFSNKSVRRAFIRKVYLLLAAQIIITFTVVCVFTLVPVVRQGVHRYPWIYYLSYAVFLATYIALGCFVECRRRWPMNLICLAIFTLALSYVTGCIAAYHNTEAVLIALAMTVVLCLAITLFAIQTKCDFTMCSGLIFALTMVVFLTGLACMIVYFVSGRNRVLQAVYAGLVLVLFSILLVYDTQQVIGGRKYEIGEEDYIFGTLQLYVDVVAILVALIGLTSISD